MLPDDVFEPCGYAGRHSAGGSRQDGHHADKTGDAGGLRQPEGSLAGRARSTVSPRGRLRARRTTPCACFHRHSRYLGRDSRRHAKGDPRRLPAQAIGAVPQRHSHTQRSVGHLRPDKGPPEQRGIREDAAGQAGRGHPNGVGPPGSGPGRCRIRMVACGREPAGGVSRQGRQHEDLAGPKPVGFDRPRGAGVEAHAALQTDRRAARQFFWRAAAADKNASRGAPCDICPTIEKQGLGGMRCHG